MSAATKTRTPPTLLIAAGGTGGHIFPGLAVRSALERRGWRVLWCGHPERMEGELVPKHGVELLPLYFAGLRGKGLATLVKLPFTLLRACVQAWRVLSRARPDVVLGMGGYVAFPAGVVARLRGVPLVIHEQNAAAGLTNRMLARIATRVLTGFPDVLPNGVAVGNPVASQFTHLPTPHERLRARSGALRLLVLGGSLGAQALNEVVPKALALLSAQLPEYARLEVRHQCGRGHVEATEAAYQRAGVAAFCTPFLVTADALAWADVVVCRAGAMTVSEVATAGVAALFVPLPHAVDDHQRANARWLADANAAWLQPQAELTPDWLADWLRGLTRVHLCEVGERARALAILDADQRIADVCGQVAGLEEDGQPDAKNTAKNTAGSAA